MTVTVDADKICGTIAARPSKSYAIRYIIAAFLSGGRVRINNVGKCDDVLRCLDCVRALGAHINYDGNDVEFSGAGKVTSAVCDCGESATLYRLLLPVVCALGVKTEFILSDSLASRDSAALIDCLNEHGARTDGASVEGKIGAGVYTIDSSGTSQYVSGLIFALSVVEGDSEIVVAGDRVSGGYIDMTIHTLKKFGVDIEKTNGRYYVRGKSGYKIPEKVTVEGDWSGAAVFLAMGAVRGEVAVMGLDADSLQKDKEIVLILRRFGAQVSDKDGAVTVKKAALKGAEVDCRDIPDLVPVLAGVAAFSDGETVLKNVARLKNKESDRVAAIVDVLNKAGARCVFNGKDIKITKGKITACDFAPINDHRIIMLETLLATGDGRYILRGAECVKKSYPEFFDDFKQIGGECRVDV